MLTMNTATISRWFLTRARGTKRAITLVVDFVAVIAALWVAFSLRYSTIYFPTSEQWWVFLLAPVVAIPVFIKFGLYRAIVRYLGMWAIWTVVKATVLYTLIFAVIILLAGPDVTGVVPRTVYGINILILLVFVGGSRLIARWWFSQYISLEQITASQQFRITPILIYGAGDAGAQLSVSLRMARQLRPVAFIDDDKNLIGQQVSGLNIYPFEKLSYLIGNHHISEVLLAMPSMSRSRRNQIITSLEPYPVRVRTLPSLSDIAQDKVKVTDVQEVDIADLLGRDPVLPITSLLEANITEKVVMVTGAGGSIGTELCRQIFQQQPKALVLVELSEFALYAIEQELNKSETNVEVYALLASVTDQKRIEAICKKFNVDTIYHTAAYKHVPLVEHNTGIGVHNNVFGTLSCARAAIASQVKTFVLISTDKAVRPTNTMGASKRLAELILQGLSAEQKQMGHQTRFTMVRFGNVLGSSGSVIPLFRQQIANGGPVTVTDERIIRYFMTIPEAAELVIQAGAMGEGGDVFVLDMGEPVLIVEMAKRMIHLSGYVERDNDHPDGDIEIVYTGLRPGEKLFEELLIGTNTTSTEHQKIMRAEETVIPWIELQNILEKLKHSKDNGDYFKIRQILQEHVEGFEPQCEVEDLLS